MKVKRLDIVKVITKLLENGVSIDTINDAFNSGGLSNDEINYIIGYIGEVEGNRLVNLTNQYLTEIKNGLDELIKSLES